MFSLIKDSFISLIQTITNNNARPASGGRQVVTRCPFCGDSDNKNHAHLYISVPQSETDVSLYDCKKCPAKGMTDENLLRKLGCYDANVLVEIQRHNNELLKLPQYKRLKSYDIYPLKNNFIRNSKESYYKLQYINNRLGQNLSYSELSQYKIFLNLYDIINTNKLELTRYKNITDQLDYYFMGFISYDNSFCTLRKVGKSDKIYKSINSRYVNYNLTGKETDTKDYYVIPAAIDISKHIQIHIAEGAIDILSVCMNLHNRDTVNKIFIANGGKSYRQSLEFVLCETGIIDYEVHIYIDKDVTDYEFRKLFVNKCMALPSIIYLHRNMKDGEKDYGVPKSQIIDDCRLLR